MVILVSQGTKIDKNWKVVTKLQLNLLNLYHSPDGFPTLHLAITQTQYQTHQTPLTHPFTSKFISSRKF